MAASSLALVCSLVIRAKLRILGIVPRKEVVPTVPSVERANLNLLRDDYTAGVVVECAVLC